MLVSGNVSDTGSEMTQVSLTIHILCTYICLLGAWETLPRKTFSEWWWMEPLKRIKIDFLIQANPKFSKLWFNGHKPRSTTACRLPFAVFRMPKTWRKSGGKPSQSLAFAKPLVMVFRTGSGSVKQKHPEGFDASKCFLVAFFNISTWHNRLTIAVN